MKNRPRKLIQPIVIRSDLASGNVLHMLRASRTMSQAELAARVGVSKRTIISIENYHSKPSVYLALAIAEALDFRVEDIFSLRRGHQRRPGDPARRLGGYRR